VSANCARSAPEFPLVPAKARVKELPHPLIPADAGIQTLPYRTGVPWGKGLVPRVRGDERVSAGTGKMAGSRAHDGTSASRRFSGAARSARSVPGRRARSRSKSSFPASRSSSSSAAPAAAVTRILQPAAASYLSRHLPGHPLFVLQEMPGAAGMVAANYL